MNAMDGADLYRQVVTILWNAGWVTAPPVPADWFDEFEPYFLAIPPAGHRLSPGSMAVQLHPAIDTPIMTVFRDRWAKREAAYPCEAFALITDAFPKNVPAPKPIEKEHFYVFDLTMLPNFLDVPEESSKAKTRKPPPEGARRRPQSSTSFAKAVCGEPTKYPPCHSLSLQIDGAINRLRADKDRLNDHEHIAKIDTQISELQRMRAQLDAICASVNRFFQGQAKEKEVIDAAKSFRKSIGNWWSQSHARISDAAATSGLFVGMVGLLHLLSIDSGLAVAITGLVIGKEDVVKGLKALPKKLF